MTALQVIIKEAKAIRSKSPKMEWKKAVAQASAIYAKKHKGKSPVGKKKAVKKATKKKLGALPIGFKGKIWGVPFKIVNQYDIYNDVSAIMEDTDTSATIVVFDGKGSASYKADAIVSYVSNYLKVSEADKKIIKSRMLKFATTMQKEVKEYNAGKKKTIKKQPLSIPLPKHKAPVVKKVAKKAAKKHTHWKTVHSHKRRVNGVKKPSEKAVLKSIKKAVSVQKAHMSSIGSHTIERLKDQMALLNKYQSFHDHYLKMSIKERPKLEIKKLKSLIKETKTHIAQLKKHI